MTVTHIHAPNAEFSSKQSLEEFGDVAVATPMFPIMFPILSRPA
jgi:hypothetical protein